MQINCNQNTFFVFDLDDTLFSEMDYLKSGFNYIAKKLNSKPDSGLVEKMYKVYCLKQNVFEWIVKNYKDQYQEISVPYLLKVYRSHMPDIQLYPAAATFLQSAQRLNIPCALITDGRSITQRNKIKALNIEHFFTDIIISEEFGSAKPDAKNYTYLIHKYGLKEYHFFGDNTCKDFIIPSSLGWKTVCLKDAGNNIHDQCFTKEHKPDFVISSFDEISIASQLQLA